MRTKYLETQDFYLIQKKTNKNLKKTVNYCYKNYIKYESIGDKDQSLAFREKIDIIRPYLSDIINNKKTQGEQKIHLRMAINFVCSDDSDETQIMHYKSNNTEIMMGSKTDEVIEELFEFLLQRYRKGSGKSIK